MTEIIDKWQELEQLRGHFYEARECFIENLIIDLETYNQFNLGYSKGYLSALDEVFDYIRNRLKYGE